MLSLESTLRLCLLVVPLMFSPGPTNFVCASAGGRFGVRRSVPMILGMDLMVFLPALIVGLGVGTVFAAHPGLLLGVQLVGALAILALAAGMAGMPGMGREHQAGAAPSRVAAPAGFWAGCSMQTLNAKGLSLLLIVESQFQDADHVAATSLAIAVWLTLLSLGSHFAWAAAGQWLARRLSSPRGVMLQGRASAAILTVTAVWLAASAVASYAAT